MTSLSELTEPLNQRSKEKNGVIVKQQKKYVGENAELIGPTDHRRFVYFSFYYIGLTILFPYTMLITIMDFWNYKVSRFYAILPSCECVFSKEQNKVALLSSN